MSRIIPDWVIVYCLECKQTTAGNGFGLAPESGTVICPACRATVTKVLHPSDFKAIPLRRYRKTLI
jgi:hypothetical protein